jgi:hypothetical protein
LDEIQASLKLNKCNFTTIYRNELGKRELSLEKEEKSENECKM